MGSNLKHRAKRIFYRNAVVAVEEVFSGRALHGPRRTWHRNGQLASEETYHHGLLHGMCRQWNEEGKLLGSYRMQNGTGIQRAWYEDGSLQMEFSTVNGKRTGRRQFWLRDGSLASEAWLIENRDVSRAEYLTEAARHRDWPRSPNERSRQRPLSRKQSEIRIYRLHCEWLLSKANTQDASKWLDHGNATSRSLGQLGFQKAKSLIAETAKHKANRVLAADIYRSKHGKEFCDSLLVQLPKAKTRRLAIRRLFKSLPPRIHCVVQPDKDGGEQWLFIYFA
jgi:hypothetical protein